MTFLRKCTSRIRKLKSNQLEAGNSVVNQVSLLLWKRLIDTVDDEDWLIWEDDVGETPHCFRRECFEVVAIPASVKNIKLEENVTCWTFSVEIVVKYMTSTLFRSISTWQSQYQSCHCLKKNNGNIIVKSWCL